MSYTELVERIIEDGKLTVDEYKTLLETANEDTLMDSEEREGILRVLTLKKEGKLQFVD